jgi:hypothetical protein
LQYVHMPYSKHPKGMRQYLLDSQDDIPYIAATIDNFR